MHQLLLTSNHNCPSKLGQEAPFRCWNFRQMHSVSCRQESRSNAIGGLFQLAIMRGVVEVRPSNNPGRKVMWNILKEHDDQWASVHKNQSKSSVERCQKWKNRHSQDGVYRFTVMGSEDRRRRVNWAPLLLPWFINPSITTVSKNKVIKRGAIEISKAS